MAFEEFSWYELAHNLTKIKLRKLNKNYMNNFKNNLLAKIEKTARTMFLHDDSVLIGVSGGPDSVALLTLLTRLAPKFSLKLGIAHLNHCLRGEDSDNDQMFVADLAKRLNLPCYIAKEDVSAYQKTHKLSLEEAGRQVRYAFFEKIRTEHHFDKIALAHHAGDNAELILMYLLRGSGTLGLSGIPPQRDGKIVRPMLNISRLEIMNFLSRENLPYCSDNSNNDTKFLRNKIRHELIPILQEYNPNISQALNRLSVILRSEEEWMQSEIENIFEDCVAEITENRISLDIAKLKQYLIAVQRRLVRKVISMLKGDTRRISFEHVESVLFLSENTTGSDKSIHFPDRIRVEKNRYSLIFAKECKSLRDPEFSSKHKRIKLNACNI